MQPTITITATGLQTRTIPLTADSTVELVEHDAGYNVYCALLVDSCHYDLCMWKHTVGRPELAQALELALAAVKAAIAELQPTPTPTPISAIIEQLPAALDAALKDITNSEKLSADERKRWRKATRKAYAWLVEQDTLDYDATAYELTLTSPDSGKTYHSNGSCQCEAHDDGIAFQGKPFPCWHRAAARLTRRSLERAAYLAAADRVAEAVEQLEEQGHSYEGSDVSIAKAALAKRIAAARAAVAAVERREQAYAEAAELFS